MTRIRILGDLSVFKDRQPPAGRILISSSVAMSTDPGATNITETAIGMGSIKVIITGVVWTGMATGKETGTETSTTELGESVILGYPFLFFVFHYNYNLLFNIRAYFTLGHSFSHFSLILDLIN